MVSVDNIFRNLWISCLDLCFLSCNQIVCILHLLFINKFHLLFIASKIACFHMYFCSSQRQQKSLNSTFPSIEYDIFDGRSQEKDLNNMCRERPSIHASLCHLSALQHNFKANWYVFHSVYGAFFLSFKWDIRRKLKAKVRLC